MKLRFILSGLLCLLIVSFTDAQSVKNVHHSFDANTATTLNIQNSFGDVTIEPHAGSKIEVEVTITIDPRKEKKLEEYFERLKIEVSESGNEVSLKTVNELNGGWKVKSFDIDYDVKMPAGTNLKVRNSFGDVKINGTDGEVELQVQHGDCFVAEAGDDNNTIRVSFGDLRINKIGKSKIDVQHGDVTLGKVGTIDLDLQFGDCDIEYLNGDAIIILAHGDIDIDDINAKLESIFIDGQFSDIEISGIDGNEFKIEMDGSFSDFDFNSSWYTQNKIKDYNTEEYILFTNGESSVKRLIKIKASHSDVDLE